MIISDENTALLLFVARQAFSTASSLSPSQRALLLEGIALILPEAEAEHAKLAAFTLRKSEAHQLQFAEILSAAEGSK